MHSGIKFLIIYKVTRLTNFPVLFEYDKGKHVPFLFSFYVNDLICSSQMNDVRGLPYIWDDIENELNTYFETV
jgi:hypothetical protein